MPNYWSSWSRGLRNSCTMCFASQIQWGGRDHCSKRFVPTRRWCLIGSPAVEWWGSPGAVCVLARPKRGGNEMVVLGSCGGKHWRGEKAGEVSDGARQRCRGILWTAGGDGGVLTKKVALDAYWPHQMPPLTAKTCWFS